MGSVVRRTRPHVARHGRLWPVIALSVVLAATGCTDTTRPAAEGSPSALPPATSTGPVRPDPNYFHTDSHEGQELLGTFPSPIDLGAGWDYLDAVDKDPDPDGVEVGIQRDVADILAGSIPDGCPRPDTLPVPEAAAEVRYIFRGIPVTAFVLGFPDRASTRAFADVLVETLDACQGEKDRAGGHVVGQVDAVADGVVMSERFPGDADGRRSDLVVLTDRSVVLLESAAELGAAPFTSQGSLRVAETFRGAAREAPPWVTRTE
jgi:hypothetical protein